MLARQVAIATGAPATFAAGPVPSSRRSPASACRPTGATTYDGSGLSRDNRLEPATLTALLDVAGSAEHPTCGRC